MGIGSSIGVFKPPDGGGNGFLFLASWMEHLISLDISYHVSRLALPAFFFLFNHHCIRSSYIMADYISVYTRLSQTDC